MSPKVVVSFRDLLRYSHIQYSDVNKYFSGYKYILGNLLHDSLMVPACLVVSNCLMVHNSVLVPNYLMVPLCLMVPN